MHKPLTAGWLVLFSLNFISSTTDQPLHHRRAILWRTICPVVTSSLALSLYIISTALNFTGPVESLERREPIYITAPFFLFVNPANGHSSAWRTIPGLWRWKTRWRNLGWSCLQASQLKNTPESESQKSTFCEHPAILGDLEFNSGDHFFDQLPGGPNIGPVGPPRTPEIEPCLRTCSAFSSVQARGSNVSLSKPSAAARPQLMKLCVPYSSSVSSDLTGTWYFRKHHRRASSRAFPLFPSLFIMFMVIIFKYIKFIGLHLITLPLIPKKTQKTEHETNRKDPGTYWRQFSQRRVVVVVVVCCWQWEIRDLYNSVTLRDTVRSFVACVERARSLERVIKWSSAAR